jgi:meso-butanediol dehydrogenase / (S,S)-butanediol dehydrogenase / diacetyl reductase
MAEAPVAVVTGAGQGIGRATAAVLVEEGYRVVLVDRNQDRLDAAAEPLGERAVPLRADVGDEGEVAALAARVGSDLGRWDVLVNNAGALRFGGVEDTTLEDWKQVFQGCVTTAWLCMRAAVPHMRATGGGRIVNLASVVVQGADSSRLIAYTAAKAGVVGLTTAAARELGPAGITVNAVSPGAVDTEAFDKFPDPGALRARRAGTAVLGRLAEPEEIGRTVAYLVSPAAAFVTGQVLLVDGGRTDKM